MEENENKDILFENHLDLENVEAGISYLTKSYTLEEIMKMVREIAYGIVSYSSPDDKGKIYDGTYTDLNIEQAARLQRRFRDIAALFVQSVINHQEFDESYLKRYLG